VLRAPRNVVGKAEPYDRLRFMRSFRLTIRLGLCALVATVAGCSPYCVDVSLEGANWYLIHPTLACFHCPYANPRCPYYDYPDCNWANVQSQPMVSAVNAPAVVPPLDQKTY
jgi:hypothetical protein